MVHLTVRCRDDPGSESTGGQSSSIIKEPTNSEISYAPFLCFGRLLVELSGSWGVPGKAERKNAASRVKTQELSVMLT